MSFLKLGQLYSHCGRRNKSTRDTWLKRTIEHIPPRSKILDAGAGELQYKKFCAHLDYVSQDFGQYNGTGDSRGLQTQRWDNTKLDIVSDISRIPVEDGSFDTIMCIEVFEHIPNPFLATKEFSRILKAGGQLIITAPVSSLTHFAPYYFYNGFSRYFYEYVLQKNGFQIEELVYNGNWFEYVAQELHRLPYVLNKYCGLKGAKFFKIISEILLLPLFLLLSIASSNDRGSNELHSFGIHVKAKKI